MTSNRFVAVRLHFILQQQLYSRHMLTPRSHLTLPDSLEEYFAWAYAAGARIHSNSWGSATNSYGDHAHAVDECVLIARHQLQSRDGFCVAVTSRPLPQTCSFSLLPAIKVITSPFNISIFSRHPHLAQNSANLRTILRRFQFHIFRRLLRRSVDDLSRHLQKLSRSRRQRRQRAGDRRPCGCSISLSTHCSAASMTRSPRLAGCAGRRSVRSRDDSKRRRCPSSACSLQPSGSAAVFRCHCCEALLCVRRGSPRRGQVKRCTTAPTPPSARAVFRPSSAPTSPSSIEAAAISPTR